MKRSPYSAAFTIIFLAVVGILLYTTDLFGLTNGTFLGGSSSVLQATEVRPDPDGHSNEFITALKTAKAGDIYNMLSASYQADLKKRGVANAAASQDLMNKRLQELTQKADGRVTYTLVHEGDVMYSDGSNKDQFSGSAQTTDGKTDFQMILTIKNGKITDVLSTEPVTVAMLALDKSTASNKPQSGTYTRTMNSTAEQFMIGLTTFDVDKVWNTFSDSFKSQLSQQNVTKDTMGNIFNGIKAINTEGEKTGHTIKYGGFAYQQTINFPNGTVSNDFETVLTSGADVSQPGYHIFLDSEGKISAIGNFNAQDNILLALLGRGQPTQ